MATTEPIRRLIDERDRLAREIDISRIRYGRPSSMQLMRLDWYQRRLERARDGVFSRLTVADSGSAGSPSDDSRTSPAGLAGRTAAV